MSELLYKNYISFDQFRLINQSIIDLMPESVDLTYRSAQGILEIAGLGTDVVVGKTLVLTGENNAVRHEATLNLFNEAAGSSIDQVLAHIRLESVPVDGMDGGTIRGVVMFDRSSDDIGILSDFGHGTERSDNEEVQNELERVASIFALDREELFSESAPLQYSSFDETRVMRLAAGIASLPNSLNS